MRRLGLLSVLLLSLAGVSLDSVEPEGFRFWTAASLKQGTHELMEQAASDPHHFAVQQLADFPNEAVLLVRREGDGQVEWHETQSDIIFVQSGSGTLLVGGTLVNGETVAPHEKRNGTIQGGIRYKVTPGDWLRIPPKTPHQFLLEGSQELDYMVIKGKGY
jgi:mannose-6-phosphate isomerase-like protein (cupin superfamily)